MLLHQIFQTPLFKVFMLILLQVEGDLGTSAKRLSIISSDIKGATSLGFPDVLLIIIMFLILSRASEELLMSSRKRSLCCCRRC